MGRWQFQRRGWGLVGCSREGLREGLLGGRGVGGRGTGPSDGANFATCVVFLLTRTKRSGVGGVPAGAGLGGRPRALIPGEGERLGGHSPWG